MTTNAVVFGAGMVGSVIAEDLVTSGFHVTVADNLVIHSLEFLSDPMEQLQYNKLIAVIKRLLHSLASESPILCSARYPVGWDIQALETVIKSGKSYCDISFMAEDPRKLNQLAIEHGATCIVDLGIAPGMSHFTLFTCRASCSMNVNALK